MNIHVYRWEKKNRGGIFQNGRLPSIGCFLQKLTQIWRNHWPFLFIGRFGIFQISCRQLRHTLCTNRSFKPTNKKAKPSRPVAGNLLRRRKEKNLRNNLKSVLRVSGRIDSYGENSSFNMNRIAMIIINFICMLIAPKEKDTHQSLGGVHAWRERGGFQKWISIRPPPLGSYPPIAGGILQKQSEKNLSISA